MENSFQDKVDNDKKNLRILLKNIRKDKKLSQTDLGNMTGLVQQQISRLENVNADEPNLNTLMKCFIALNIDIVDLIKNNYSN